MAVPVTRGADELRFKNGDRLTGAVIEQTGELIRFRHATLGEVRIAAAEAEVVELSATPPESLAGLPPLTEPAPPAPAVPPAAPPAIKPAAMVASGARPDPSRWRGKIEFGFKQQSGATDSVDFSLRGDTERKISRNQYRATGRLLYGRKMTARARTATTQVSVGAGTLKTISSARL